MAILGQVTIDEIAVYSVSADPSVDGFAAAIGSIASLDDDTNGRLWIKSGAGNTAWSIIPRLPNATALTANRFVFPDANGMLVTTPYALWEGGTGGRFSFGLNAPATPQSTIHLDRGNAQGVHVRMTAGTTTGQTAGDGTEFGIDNAGAAEILQRENSPVNFYTNGILRGSFAAAGNFIVGATSTPIDITGASALPQFQIIGTSAVQMAGIQYSADTIGPVFNLLKSRGATIGTQGLVSPGDEFGRIQFRASDGTNFQAGASIRALVDGTAATNSMPGYLLLMTTPSGSATPVERMRIDSLGQVTLSQNLILGPTAGTANGSLQLASNGELQGRQGGVWYSLGMNPTVITSGTGALSTTSGTYSTITGLTTTPAAGTYMVFYSVNGGSTANGSGDVSIFLAGNEQVETTRNIGATANFGSTATANGTASAMTVLTVNGSQVVDVRFRRNTAGTFSVTNKVFILIPISR